MGAAAHPLVSHSPAQVRRLRAKARDAVDHVHDEVQAVEVVEHDNLERGRGRALFRVSANMDLVVVASTVG
jgi:hypothetical protein